MNKTSNEIEQKQCFSVSKSKTQVENIAENAISPQKDVEIGLNSRNVVNNGEDSEPKEEVDVSTVSIAKLEQSRSFENYGRQEINAFIIAEFVNQIEVPFIREFLNNRMHLDPQILLQLYKVVEKLIKEVSMRHNKKPSQLKREDFGDVDAFKAIINTVGSGMNSYLKALYKTVNPFGNSDLLVRDSKQKETFNNPFVNRLAEELRKRGTKETSTENNLRVPSRRFFKWAIKVYPDFSDYTINNIPVWKFSNHHLQEYKAYLMRQIEHGKYTELTAKRQLQYVLRLFTLGFQLKLLLCDITRNVENIKAEEYVQRELPVRKDISRFRATVWQYSDNPAKDLLRYDLMLFMGLRAEEVATTRHQDVNLSRGTLTIKRKGGKRQTLRMPDVVYEGFQLVGVQQKGFYFGDNPKSIKGKLDRDYKLYCLIAGWKFKGGVHLFRHKFTTNLARFATPRQIKIARGDKSDMTVMKYIHKTDDEMRAAVNKIRI